MLYLENKNFNAIFAESAFGMAAAPDSFRVTLCFSALVKRSAPQVKGFSEAPEYKSCTRITRTSDSSEVTPFNWSRLALNRKKLKNHVRGGVLPNIRKDMWLGVLGVSDADSVLLAKAFGEPDDSEFILGLYTCHRMQVIIFFTAEQITRGVSKYFGLPFDLDYIAPFYVIPSFSTGLDRVLSALKRTLEEKQFDAAPLLPILATLMLHFLEEWEVFAGLSHLVHRQGWIDHTHSQLGTSSNMLLSLLNTHMVTATCQCRCADMCIHIASAEIYCTCPPEIEASLAVHGYIFEATSGALVYVAFLPSAILDHCECRGCRYCYSSQYWE